MKLLLVLLAIIAVCHCQTTITPFGERPSQCVVEVPSGSTISETKEGLLQVVFPSPDADGETVKLFAPSPECHADAPYIKEFNMRREPIDISDPEFPINGWLDYGGWYPPNGQNNLNRFQGTYTIPQNPAEPNGGEVLFYFIGMQDNDAPNYLNIIQPVLTWGNGLNQWYVQSWACCPANITVASQRLTGLQAGQNMYGIIQRLSASTWEINSIWQNQNTTLYAQVGDFNYNWADVTLEVYRVDNCAEFAGGTAIFSNLALYDVQGTKIQPQWQYTPETACNGNIHSVNANTVVISHSN